MTESTIQAGSSVESQCKKCKALTDHHVVIMDGDKIAKVECKVCSGRHAYKPAQAAPKEPKEPKAKAPAKPSRQTAFRNAQTATALAFWEKAVSAGKPVPYGMTSRYKVGDVIDHSSFGLGAVQKIMRPNTMSVLFSDSLRNLRCGGER